MFTTRLWGFYGSDLDVHIQTLLREVGLFEEKNRIGKDLSMENDHKNKNKKQKKTNTKKQTTNKLLI